MKFTREPVAWITFLVVVATVVRDVLTGSLDIGTAVNTAIAALGGITARQLVTPVEKPLDK